MLSGELGVERCLFAYTFKYFISLVLLEEVLMLNSYFSYVLLSLNYITRRAKERMGGRKQGEDARRGEDEAWGRR